MSKVAHGFIFCCGGDFFYNSPAEKHCMGHIQIVHLVNKIQLNLKCGSSIAPFKVNRQKNLLFCPNYLEYSIPNSFQSTINSLVAILGGILDYKPVDQISFLPEESIALLFYSIALNVSTFRYVYAKEKLDKKFTGSLLQPKEIEQLNFFCSVRITQCS